jgi:hypothetical protein
MTKETVFRSETEFVLAIYRTQLFNPDDLDDVKQIQAQYQVQPLSDFVAESAPKAAPVVDYIKPLMPQEQKTSVEFFNILSFILQFCPVSSSEAELQERFAKIDVGAGMTLDTEALSADVRTALEQGMADAWTALAELQKRVEAGAVTSGDLFGTREYLQNNYLYRMAGAFLGIYGNSKAEAMYPMYALDAGGEKLNGANQYTLHFAPGQFPPINAFWSLTMYELPASLLVANPINRYLINSPMLPQLQKDGDGGITFYVQHESPGAEQETNWLPAPTGPFFCALRMYWPKAEALSGGWTQPPMEKV